MHAPARLGLRILRRRPLRSALTIAGIAIGVALVFAALSVDAAAQSGARGYAAQLDGRSDLVVRAFGEGTLSPQSLSAISSTTGVLGTSPQVRRTTFAWSVAPGGIVATRSLGALTVVGVDPEADRAFHDESVVAGAALTAADDGGVVLAEPWASAHGLAVGSRISLMGGGGERTLAVRGVLAASGPALADGGRLAYVTITTARALFALPTGAVDVVEVRVDPAVGVAAVETRLETRLSSEPYLLSTTADDAAALSGASRDIGSGLLLVAAVVLFVGALLVSDALAMSVAERSREVALLRSAGATRGQVHAMVVVEALGMAVAGTAAGIVLGAVMATALVPIVASISDAPVSGAPLDPGALVVAVLLGVLVPVVAALGPAWRAGRVAPVEALRGSALRPRPNGGIGRSAVEGAAASVTGTTVLILGAALTGASSPSGAAPIAGGPAATFLAAVVVALAVLLLVLIAGLVAPAVLRVAGAVVGLAALPLRRSLGAEMRLARGSLAHDPARISVAFAALAVGLGLVVALAGIADGMRRAGEAWIADVAPADYAVVAISPVPDSFGADLAAVSGVSTVTPLRLFDVAIAGRRASAVAVDPGAYARLGALTVVDGSRDAAFAALQAGGAALVPRSVADRFGLRVGDSLGLRTASGEESLRVAAVVAHGVPGAAGESVVVSQSDASRLGISGVSMFLVVAKPGASSALSAALSDVADRYALSVVRPSSIGGAVTGALDRTFGLLDALAVAAVIIAVLSMLDVLLMDVRQRVGELGLLRAVGLTRAQAWRAVVLEAAIVGLAGSVAACVLGVLGATAVLGLGTTAGIQLAVPWAPVGLALLIGLVGAVLVSVYPARLAARVDIARALRAE